LQAISPNLGDYTQWERWRAPTRKESLPGRTARRRQPAEQLQRQSPEFQRPDAGAGVGGERASGPQIWEQERWDRRTTSQETCQRNQRMLVGTNPLARADQVTAGARGRWSSAEEQEQQQLPELEKLRV